MKNLMLTMVVACLAGCVGQGSDGSIGGAVGEARSSRFSSNYQSRGEFADAYFYGMSPDGCAWWSGSVSGGESVTHAVGTAPVTGSFAYAYIYGYNWCTGRSFDGWGTGSGPTIDRLNSAHFSLPLTVYSNQCVWVDCAGSTDPRCAPPPACDPLIDPWCCDPSDPRCGAPPPPPPGYYECTWESQTGTFVADLTGEGDTSRGINMSNYASGPYRSSWRSNGAWRSASAVGSLEAGGYNLLAGATGWGTLHDDASSSHTFYRY